MTRTHTHGDASEQLADLTDQLIGILWQIRTTADGIACPTDGSDCEFTDNDPADLCAMVGRLEHETANVRRLADLAVRRERENQRSAQLTP